MRAFRAHWRFCRRERSIALGPFPLGGNVYRRTAELRRDRCALATMLRCVTRGLWYEFKDVKSKAFLEKLAKSKVKAGMDPSDIDMEELAMESGLAPSNTANVKQFVQEKENVINMLREQRLRRVARREAFLEWQAGQREKGAAHRLLRQSRKAEKYKQRHYHATSGRMVPVLTAQPESLNSAYHVSSLGRAPSPDALRKADGPRWERLYLTLRKK
jgi:hypothetical protein